MIKTILAVLLIVFLLGGNPSIFSLLRDKAVQELKQ